MSNGITGFRNGEMGSAILHRSLDAPPIKVASAKGSRLALENGRQIFDATGGAAVCCLGHGDPRVVEAITKQLSATAYVHSGFFSTNVCEELGQVLIDSTGGIMQRVLLLSSGM